MAALHSCDESPAPTARPTKPAPMISTSHSRVAVAKVAIDGDGIFFVDPAENFALLGNYPLADTVSKLVVDNDRLLVLTDNNRQLGMTIAGNSLTEKVTLTKSTVVDAVLNRHQFYLVQNNVIEEHTSKNFYCTYASSLIPYVLVDGRVSACCRDYDGSLVVDDLNKNQLKQMKTSEGFKNLQKAHMDEDDSINNYNLCKSCYVVDERVCAIWGNLMTLLLNRHPNEKADFYQSFFNDALAFTKNIDYQNYKNLVSKYTLT